jgi:tetratricopeptide (TPR) repeat protein
LSGAPQAAEPSPAPLNPGVPADKKFPFPGESGAAKPGATPGSGSSSSSSSSSSADGEPNPADRANSPDAGDHPELQDKGSEGQQTLPGRHILHRVNPPGTKLQSPDERAAEDLDVARFYMDSGDLAAAYSRSQDAVKLFPDDAEAQFTLAEAAAKLNKRDEAIDHYQQCLKLDPIDKQAKAARKALARLQAKR